MKTWLTSWGLLLATLTVNLAKGENILFFIGGISSHSHRYGMEPIAFRLVEKGHNVTFFSPLKPSKPNSKIINYIPPELMAAHKDFASKFGVFGLQERIKKKFNMDMGNDPDEIFDMNLAFNEITLKSEGFQRWMNQSQFDLVVVDKSTLSDLAYVLAHKFDAKLISYTGIASVIPWDFYLYGIPSETSWIPLFDHLNFEGKEMGFFDRLYSEMAMMKWRNAYQRYLVKQDKQFREMLNMPDMPPLRDLITSESIIFTNMHYSDGYAKSLPPFMIPVGGMHLEESNGTLPKDIAEFIEGAGEEGFMYISFGSIVSISTMPSWLLDVIFNALKTSKMRFLWKWEGEKPENVPENVFLLKWFPQNDVLAHPKIKGFVTQGGQVSMQQAIFHGVPVLIFPVNGDQDFNAKRVRRYGNGIEMEFHGLTSTDLVKGIKELTEDPKYKESARRLSVASKQRPLSALDEAMWWTEFVMRTDKEQMKLLKPLSMGQPWWKVQMLDVWAFIASGILLAAFISLVLIRLLFKFAINVFSGKSSKDMKKKKL